LAASLPTGYGAAIEPEHDHEPGQTDSTRTIDALLAEAETSKDRPLAAVAEVGRAAGITTKAVQQRWGPSR
jgi:hypothetical protein